MNILTISTLYPNPVDLKHGIFVRTRSMHLVKHHPDIKPIIIAPVPWFFFSSELLGNFASFKKIPSVRNDNGLEVHHPRYLVIPKLGMFLAPFTLAWSLKRSLKKLVADKRKLGVEFSLIDGHYFFPDGVAIAKAAKALKLPFVCTARGTDINLIPENPLAKKMVLKVLQESRYNFAVCQALKDEMVALGADESKVSVLRNGVDLELFEWSNNEKQLTLKKQVGIEGRLVVSVGGLVERKGHHLTIEAIANMPDVHFVLVGDGPEKNALLALAKRLEISDRVTLTGALTQPEVNKWFMAADCSVLASSREGWANVLLESMASGCPVVATDVWGTPEVVQSENVGRLCERNVASIASEMESLLAQTTLRNSVRSYAESFDWKETSDKQREFFATIT